MKGTLDWRYPFSTSMIVGGRVRNPPPQKKNIICNPKNPKRFAIIPTNNWVGELHPQQIP